jgi:hypothetical protein
MTWRADNPHSDQVAPEDDPLPTDTDRMARDSDQPAAERDRDPLAAENDQIVRQDAQILPPDDEQMTRGGDPAAHDELAQDDDLVIMTDDHELAQDDDQPGSGETPDADRPARVFVIPAPAAEPAPALAAGIGPVPAADTGRTSVGGRWHEILAMFVDDPHTSVEQAAGLVDDSTEALVASLRQRQQALRAAWQGNDAETEALRNALQQYRAFWDRLEDFSG